MKKYQMNIQVLILGTPLIFFSNSCSKDSSGDSRVASSATCKTNNTSSLATFDEGAAHPKKSSKEFEFLDSGRSWGIRDFKVKYPPDGTVISTAPGILFQRMNAVAATAVWQREGARALAMWQAVIPFNFSFIDSNSATPANIYIVLETSLPSSYGNALGMAYYPSVGITALNSMYTFVMDQSSGQYTFFKVLLHELGHVLGLDHSSVVSIMQPVYGQAAVVLADDDIAGIQSKYGARVADAFEGGSGNNTLATAYPLQINSSTFALPSTADLGKDDVDYYVVNSLPNNYDTIKVTANSSGLSLLSPKIEILNSAGQVIASQTTAQEVFNGAEINATASATDHKFYVKVSSANGDFSTGKYTLSFEASQTGESSAPLLDPSPLPTIPATTSIPNSSDVTSSEACLK